MSNPNKISGFGMSQQAPVDRLLYELSLNNWTTGTPDDRLNLMLSRTQRATRITTANPSAAVEQSLVSARLTANRFGKPLIQGTVIHRPSWVGKRLMKELPLNQIQGGRSRPGILASSKLQETEILRRVQKLKDTKDKLESFRMPSRTSEAILAVKKRATLEALRVDKDYLNHYLSEHKDSSILPGVKWAQLPTPDEDISFWNKCLDLVKGNLEQYAFAEGMRYNGVFNTGARQRADQEVIAGDWSYDLEVSRTRVVLFNPQLSMIGAFMPDKPKWYGQIINAALQEFGISDHLLFPPRDGGDVYIGATEALVDNEDTTIVLGDDLNFYKGGKQYALDGSNWESSVGTILGEPFYGTKTYFGGNYHVPSGVFDTTLDDTLATLWVRSQLSDAEIMAGGIPDIMEVSQADQDLNFMLGLRYVDDPHLPRLQGLKLAVDKAGGQRIVPRGGVIEVHSRYTEDQRERWYWAYHGLTPDGSPILHDLAQISPTEWRGGMVTDRVLDPDPTRTS